jgi:hypothetical protein
MLAEKKVKPIMIINMVRLLLRASLLTADD